MTWDSILAAISGAMTDKKKEAFPIDMRDEMPNGSRNASMKTEYSPGQWDFNELIVERPAKVPRLTVDDMIPPDRVKGKKNNQNRNVNV